MKNKVHQTFRVYGDNPKAYLELSFNEDGLDLIELVSGGVEGEEYYGKPHLPLTKELAKLLGEVLIKMSAEMSR